MNVGFHVLIVCGGNRTGIMTNLNLLLRNAIDEIPNPDFLFILKAHKNSFY